MENVILIFVLTAILDGAIAYIIHAKKQGVKCIGCLAGGSCGTKKNGSCCSGCNSCNSEGCGCGCGGESEQGGCGCHEETK